MLKRLRGELMSNYPYRILLAIDQLFNAILGGDEDETISSRMGKHVVKKDSRLCKFICSLLNKIDPNHCSDAIEKDEGLPM